MRKTNLAACCMALASTLVVGGALAQDRAAAPPPQQAQPQRPQQQQRAAAGQQEHRLSFLPVDTKEPFASVMKRMSAAKPEVMRRQQTLLEQRYDLADRPVAGVEHVARQAGAGRRPREAARG